MNLFCIALGLHYLCKEFNYYNHYYYATTASCQDRHSRVIVVL